MDTLEQLEEALIEKDALIKQLKEEVTSLRLQITQSSLKRKSDLDIMLMDIVYNRGVGADEIFESQEAMCDEPKKTAKDDWAYFESVLKRRYIKLANYYHPDNYGSQEQLDNLAHAYEIARTFVKSNEGLGK